MILERTVHKDNELAKEQLRRVREGVPSQLARQALSTCGRQIRPVPRRGVCPRAGGPWCLTTMARPRRRAYAPWQP